MFRFFAHLKVKGYSNAHNMHGLFTKAANLIHWGAIMMKRSHTHTHIPLSITKQSKT